MPTYSRHDLSGSTNGMPIPVAATASPGTLVHTAIAGTIGSDEIYFWVSNVTGAAATLTVEWGGTTDPGSLLVKNYSIPAYSDCRLIASGQTLRNGLVIRAFSGTASALNITGYVNRIS